MFRKMLASLKRKYGPLPLWAWAAIVGGALALWFRMRRGPAEADAPAIAEPAFAYGPAESDFGDTGAPAPVGEVAPVDPAAGELYPDNKLREASMELIDQIRGISDELAATAYAPPAAGSEDVVEPDRPEDVGGDRAQPEAGVRWGGRVFTTKAGLGAWLAARYGGRGQAARAYREWAAKHPGAAAKLAGPAPRPPKRKPAKAPKRPSARTGSREPAKGGRGAGGARARGPQPKASKPARSRASAPRRQAPAPPKPKPKAKPRRRLLRRGLRRSK